MTMYRTESAGGRNLEHVLVDLMQDVQVDGVNAEPALREEARREVNAISTHVRMQRGKFVRRGLL